MEFAPNLVVDVGILCDIGLELGENVVGDSGGPL